MIEDKRLEFLEILKHGRDTRPEKAWCLVGRYQLNRLGYGDVPMMPAFGIAACGTLQRWPKEHDLHLSSSFAEIFTKGWVKASQGVLPEPRNHYFSYREEVCDIFGEVVCAVAADRPFDHVFQEGRYAFKIIRQACEEGGGTMRHLRREI